MANAPVHGQSFESNEPRACNQKRSPTHSRELPFKLVDAIANASDRRILSDDFYLCRHLFDDYYWYNWRGIIVRKPVTVCQMRAQIVIEYATKSPKSIRFRLHK